MQEEVTRGAVTLIVDGVKLSEQVFEKAVKKFLEEIQKSQKPKIYRGRQSLKQLASQNAGLANIEISDKNIMAFSRVAKKYHVDFALKKDTAAEQPRYLVFFKSRDADAITAAFQEFASRKMSREEKPSIRERLTQAKEQAAEKTEHRTIDREKVRGIFRTTGNPSFAPKERSRLWQNRPPTVSLRPRGTGRPLLRSYFSITAAQKHSATSYSNWCLPTVRVYPRLTVKSRKKQKSCDNSRPDEPFPVRAVSI